MTLIDLGAIVVALASLLDDGQGCAHQLGEGTGALGVAQVGHHDRVLQLLLLPVVGEHVGGGQLVDGDVEEALDLALVQVHRQQPIGTGDADHVGDETSRDGYPRLVLLVRATVGVVGHDGGDAPGAGALEGIDHDEQLHDRLLDRLAGGLQQEDVLLAHVVDDAHEDVLVGELEHLRRAELHAQVATDLGRQAGIGVAAVQPQRLAGTPGVRLAEGRHLTAPTRSVMPAPLRHRRGLPGRARRAHSRRHHAAAPGPRGRRRCRRPCRLRSAASR